MTFAACVVAGLLALALTSARGIGGRSATRRGIVLAALAGMFAAIQFSADFDGYDSDLWTYLLIVERTAEGLPMRELDPFSLAPPPTPHVSTLWLALGHLRELSHLPLEGIARSLSIASAIFLSVAAWRLVRRLLPVEYRFAAFVFFWLSLESWADLCLGRTLVLGFVLLLTEAALAPGRRLVAVAVLLAAAFHVHFFGGLLGIMALLLGTACRGEWRPQLLRERAFGIGAALVLAAPCIDLVLRTLRLPVNAAHLWQPGQFRALGRVWLDPLHLWPPRQLPLLSLALLGIVMPARPGTECARRLARYGFAFVALVFLTPLYDLSVHTFGGWMTGRLTVLTFSWLAAALGLMVLLQPGSRVAYRYAALAVAIVACAFVPKVLDALAPFGTRPEPFTFAEAARAEARALRSETREQSLISVDLLAYALSTPTLGIPLAVPPGHASPFVDFAGSSRRVHQALSTNSPACWRAFFARYPGPHILVTPADGATVEQGIWRRRVTAAPADVRRVLARLGWLHPARRGRFFVVDRLSRPWREAVRADGTTRRGSRCLEDEVR